MFFANFFPSMLYVHTCDRQKHIHTQLIQLNFPSTALPFWIKIFKLTVVHSGIAFIASFEFYFHIGQHNLCASLTSGALM